MKVLSIASAILFFLVACSSNESKDGQSLDIQQLINDFELLEKSEAKNPIVEVRKAAKDQADKVIKFNKNNIAKMLYDAREYAHCIIIVDDHTLVLISDFEDCQESSSWGACMPWAKGYIKRGKLVRKEDYLNNLIGTPDMQVRKAFFFN